MSLKSDRRRSFARPPMLEGLEERRLLSGFSISFGSGFNSGMAPGSPGLSISFGSSSNSGVQSHFVSSGVPRALLGRAILFSQAPDAVQTGLDDLAAAKNVAAPADDDLVFLDNVNGIESFTLFVRDFGFFARLQVDQFGNEITDPVRSTTDWLTFSTDQPEAAASILTIADALDLKAPVDDTTVFVKTQNGQSTFTVSLRSSFSRYRRTSITVDEAGNPLGDGVRLPFSALPTTIQDGLIANAPAGVTLDATSRQTVTLKRFDNVQTYSMTFRVNRMRTTIMVDTTGNLIEPPSRDFTTFDQIPSAAQDELQFLASENNLDAISDSARVVAYTQLNGVTVYQVFLRTFSGRFATLSVDQDGIPTVPSRDDFFSFFSF